MVVSRNYMPQLKQIAGVKPIDERSECTGCYMNSVQQFPTETIREHVDREMLMCGQLKETVGHMDHLDRKMAERTMNDLRTQPREAGHHWMSTVWMSQTS